MSFVFYLFLVHYLVLLEIKFISVLTQP